MYTLVTGKWTEDRKLNGVSKSRRIFATYRPCGTTCPSECSFLGICYAEEGNVRFSNMRSARRNDDLYECINSLPYRGMLRHVVSGDLFYEDKPDREYIDAMISGHKERPDVKGIGYTHGWRRLSAQEFSVGGLCLNASTEGHEETLEALERGWDVCMVIPSPLSHAEDKEGEYILMQCPAIHGEEEKQKVDCMKCQLCSRRGRTLKGKKLVIGFPAHGNRSDKIKSLLKG